jgi:hypothetical protein
VPIQNLPKFFLETEFGVMLLLGVDVTNHVLHGSRSLVEKTQCARRLSYQCDMREIVRHSAVPSGDFDKSPGLPAVETAGYYHPSRFAGLRSRATSRTRAGNVIERGSFTIGWLILILLHWRFCFAPNIDFVTAGRHDTSSITHVF